MGGRPMCPTLRPRRSATSTWVRPHWRLPTRKASRSANKVSDLKAKERRGNDPRRFFYVKGTWKRARSRLRVTCGTERVCPCHDHLARVLSCAPFCCRLQEE